MKTAERFIATLDGYIWGVPLITLIVFCGLLLSVRTRFLQVHKLSRAFRYMLKDEEGESGEVSGFAALCTALSATVGTGNIVGVATSIAAGGPGALLWMEAAAFFGMATKYAEGLLAVKYRTVSEDGSILGGPFYYIENGLGKRWKPLAKIFALFGILAGLMGIGTITQVNGITSAANLIFDPEKANTFIIFGRQITVTTVVVGAVITILAALIIIGGIKRISSVSKVVVPVMIVLYIGCCLTIIVTHIPELPGAVATIVRGAFGLRPIAGGITGFAVMRLAVRSGISRGVFSNEAGLGSAPIAAAAARTNEPARQGLVTMMGTFIDTIIVCTMTGIAIVMSGSFDKGLKGVEITTDAFCNGLPFPERVSAVILLMSLAVFAFTTILGWNYYSERCLSYLIGGSNKTASLIFRLFYIAAVFIGPYLAVEAVWNLADIFNGLMAIPNVTALILLSGVVSDETRAYVKRLESGDAE